MFESYLYDPIRAKQVAATPEEKVRQALIRQMIGPLGYPRGLLAVEKDLRSLVSIPKWENSDRRIDLLCFMPGSEGLKPLLLVECKAQAIDEEDGKSQVFGYNQKICAPFIGLASPLGVKILWHELGRIVSVPFLPSFSQLIEKICVK